MESPNDARIFEIMLCELESRFPETILVPAPDPKHHCHFIRVAIMTNPQWYRDLCEKYPSSRRDNGNGKRTRIKRGHISELLSRLISGEIPQSVYLNDLIKAKNEKRQKLQNRNI